jgi:hypothetical protein
VRIAVDSQSTNRVPTILQHRNASADIIAASLLRAIDGQEVYGKDLDQVAKCIVGPEGAEVRLGFASEDASYTEVALIRALPVERYHYA